MNNVKTLKEYTDFLDQSAKKLPLKIMGETTSKQSFTLTMLGDVYKNSQDPDQAMPADAPFGKILRRGASPESDKIYSVISPSTSQNDLFQGDLVEFDTLGKIDAGKSSSHVYSCILSHSCDISNSPFILLAPVFRESELNTALMSFLKGGAFRDARAEDATRATWLLNEKARFAAFPASAVLPGLDEPYLIPLDLLITVTREEIISRLPVQRLSYRGLSFLQWRLGTIYLRDVKDSDETRDY